MRAFGRRRGSDRDLVMRVLVFASTPLTTNEVARRAGIMRRVVIVPLCSLARDGHIMRDDDGDELVWAPVARASVVA